MIIRQINSNMHRFRIISKKRKITSHVISCSCIYYPSMHLFTTNHGKTTFRNMQTCSIDLWRISRIRLLQQCWLSEPVELWFWNFLLLSMLLKSKELIKLMKKSGIHQWIICRNIWIIRTSLHSISRKSLWTIRLITPLVRRKTYKLKAWFYSVVLHMAIGAFLLRLLILIAQKSPIIISHRWWLVRTIRSCYHSSWIHFIMKHRLKNAPLSFLLKSERINLG